MMISPAGSRASSRAAHPSGGRVVGLGEFHGSPWGPCFRVASSLEVGDRLRLAIRLHRFLFSLCGIGDHENYCCEIDFVK